MASCKEGEAVTVTKSGRKTNVGRKTNWFQTESRSETTDSTDSVEEFITLPKPKPFTRAKVNSAERRPAAVLRFCHFLFLLSAKCKSNLTKLGCTKRNKHGDSESEPWEKRFLRLKVYQRAFSAIVMHFKAYCPVLFHIKKTYEDMLSYRIHQIKIAQFERKRLAIQKQNMKQQMDQYQFPEYAQLVKSEKYLSILRRQINVQDEAIKVITGILTKMEDSLSDHFERHRDLEEQIIMVDTEITSRRQKAFSKRIEEEEKLKIKESESAAEENANTVQVLEEVDSDEEDKEDPFYYATDVDEDRRMVWLMAFAICLKDLEDAEKKLKMYEIKYQYVVPRHEIENMKANISSEKVAAKQLTDEKAALEEELANLVAIEEKMTEELTEVKNQLMELRTSVTPRPSWEQLGEFVQGGVPKWEKMIQGKSTKEVAEKLFTELRSRRTGEKYLNPLGTDPPVLKCLRHGKRISDRQLHSRDAALLINDLYMERARVLLENMTSAGNDDVDFGKGENLALKSFPDYVASYFEQAYEDADLRMEWTYNLVECCKRFSLDYRLTQFLNVLQTRVDEGIYTVTRNELFRIRNSFIEKSIREGMPNATLSSNQYVEVLEATFPGKEEPEIQNIVRVTNKLNVELNPEEDADLSTYHITQLIDVRDDGFRGALVSELVKQFEVDRQEFIEKIIEVLADELDVPASSAGREHDPAGDREVSVVQVYNALTRADSSMDDATAGAALAWIFAGTSVLPGSGMSGSRLVNYCKIHRGSETMNDAAKALDDDKFERAIRDVIHEDDEEHESLLSMTEAQKKSYFKAHKQTKLRNVVKGLRTSALVSSDKAYDPKLSPLPDGPIEDFETDLAALKDMIKKEAPEPELEVAAGGENAGEGMTLNLDSGEDPEDGASTGPATAAPATAGQPPTAPPPESAAPAPAPPAPEPEAPPPA